MSEFEELINKQRLLLEAEAWVQIPKSVHIHKLKSMWYDDRPEDTDKGHVIDIQYPDNRVVRMQNGKTIHEFGEKKTGQELLDLYNRGGI